MVFSSTAGPKRSVTVEAKRVYGTVESHRFPFLLITLGRNGLENGIKQDISSPKRQTIRKNESKNTDRLEKSPAETGAM
jgi:hypothetical protein